MPTPTEDAPQQAADATPETESAALGDAGDLGDRESAPEPAAALPGPGEPATQLADDVSEAASAIRAGRDAAAISGRANSVPPIRTAARAPATYTDVLRTQLGRRSHGGLLPPS
ncbi:hypothetical protein GCM10011578_066690 [Streptomyces fuscichromogenes]|uniref:Uncharacterized protein n=1 Tax=Streptomyces fuscichromogenes TaxID=1324013 RepID=A0A917XJT7_9ACTN|nr:hypothetical protein GCM10011578_066690 [Streptomyces fuscichromogenes]